MAAILAGMRIGLLGLGLIGGSVVRALRHPSGSDRSAGWSIAAWTPGGRGPAAALAEGTIDQAADTPQAAIDGADLVVLAGPAPDCLAQLDELAGAWHQVLAPDDDGYVALLRSSYFAEAHQIEHLVEDRQRSSATSLGSVRPA